MQGVARQAKDRTGTLIADGIDTEVKTFTLIGYQRLVFD